MEFPNTSRCRSALHGTGLDMTYQSDQSTENHFILPPASCEGPPLSQPKTAPARQHLQAPLPTARQQQQRHPSHLRLTILPTRPPGSPLLTPEYSPCHGWPDVRDQQHGSRQPRRPQASFCPLHDPLVRTTLGAPTDQSPAPPAEYPLRYD